METRRGKPKSKGLGELAQTIARGEQTVMDILQKGTSGEAETAAEYFFILRGIQMAIRNVLPPPDDPTAVISSPKSKN